MLETGIRGELTLAVTNENTAAAIGSGTLDVLATPALAALMEKTAWTSVAPFIDEGFCTVGGSICIKHLAPTPVGKTVRCESVLVEIDRKRLAFELIVYDDGGKIGVGTHERFIVEQQAFLAKAAERSAAQS